MEWGRRQSLQRKFGTHISSIVDLKFTNEVFADIKDYAWKPGCHFSPSSRQLWGRKSTNTLSRPSGPSGILWSPLPSWPSWLEYSRVRNSASWFCGQGHCDWVFVWFLFFLFWFVCTACRILAPTPETEPKPCQWKLQVLTTGLPGNFLVLLLKRCLVGIQTE